LSPEGNCRLGTGFAGPQEACQGKARVVPLLPYPLGMELAIARVVPLPKARVVPGIVCSIMGPPIGGEGIVSEEVKGGDWVYVPLEFHGHEPKGNYLLPPPPPNC
jgi:hypothetical protein